MNEIPILDSATSILTPRLCLRPIQVGDGAIIHPAKRESWDELLPWMIWTQKPLDELTVADDEEFCCRKQQQFVARQGLTYLAFHRDHPTTADNFVGAGSLNEFDWQQRQFTLGYWVRSSLTGHGYATEIGAALVTFAFKQLKADLILTHHAVGNDGSRRVIEKLGFVFDRVKPQFEQLHDGRSVDHLLYHLSDPASLPALNVQWSSPA
jgi:RimJ/RimL family protein N-acetyltransferase